MVSENRLLSLSRDTPNPNYNRLKFGEDWRETQSITEQT